jgi:hypothetical protein
MKIERVTSLMSLNRHWSMVQRFCASAHAFHSHPDLPAPATARPSRAAMNQVEQAKVIWESDSAASWRLRECAMADVEGDHILRREHQEQHRSVAGPTGVL